MSICNLTQHLNPRGRKVKLTIYKKSNKKLTNEAKRVQLIGSKDVLTNKQTEVNKIMGKLRTHNEIVVFDGILLD